MSKFDENSFRTKTGTCTITPERIILSREGLRGVAAERIFANSISRGLTFYSVLGVAALIFGIWSMTKYDFVTGSILCLVGLFFVWNVITSRNNSATPVIERSTIRTIDVHPPHPPLTRGYFAVLFLEGNKERKRLIMLPGSLEGGQDEFERAMTVMRKTGLLEKP